MIVCLRTPTCVHMASPLDLQASLDDGERIEAASDRERGEHAEGEEFRLVHHVPLDGSDERSRLHRSHDCSVGWTRRARWMGNWS